MQQMSAAEQSRMELEAMAAARDAGVVTVEIYDQIYQLRGQDVGYIERLAGVVDDKMRAVAAHGATVDSLRVAVLAALNIADELLVLKGRYESLISSQTTSQQAQSSIRTRAGSLAGMLDEVLLERAS